LSELASVSKEEAEEQRAAAVGAGAEQKAADRLFAGDETYVEAESLAAETKTEDAVFRYERARLYYELAYKRSIAFSLMGTIREKDYARWDSGNFQLGEKKFNLEETLWSSDDESKRSDGLDALDEAVLRFNLVIQKGRESVALAAKTNAEVSKTRAEEIKADAAAREEYAEAAELLREAESLFQYKEYEEALAVYERAMSAFDRAYEIAAEKRSRAAQALRAAQEAVEKSREKADSADPIVNTGAP
jgi:tetratricopeptide (TPR) repeat protein